MGFGLQVLNTKKGVLGPMPVLLLSSRTKPGPQTRRSNRITIREERDDGQRIGRQRIPTRVCLRVTTGRQKSTRFGEGSSRSEKVRGEFASSALNKAPVSEVRQITIGGS